MFTVGMVRSTMVTVVAAVLLLSPPTYMCPGFGMQQLSYAIAVVVPSAACCKVSATRKQQALHHRQVGLACNSQASVLQAAHV